MGAINTALSSDLRYCMEEVKREGNVYTGEKAKKRFLEEPCIFHRAEWDSLCVGDIISIPSYEELSKYIFVLDGGILHGKRQLDFRFLCKVESDGKIRCVWFNPFIFIRRVLLFDKDLKPLGKFTDDSVCDWSGKGLKDNYWNVSYTFRKHNALYDALFSIAGCKIKVVSCRECDTCTLSKQEYNNDGSRKIVPKTTKIFDYVIFSGPDYAPGTKNVHKITFVIDEEEIASINLKAGDLVIPPTTEIRENYLFQGWEHLPEKMPEADIFIYGNYVKNVFQVTYIIDGEEFATECIKSGDLLIRPEVMNRENFHFSGWKDCPSNMPEHDIIVYGHYERNIHIVTYIIDDETFGEDIAEAGTDLNTKEAPPKHGHKFSGWENLPSVMPDHDLVLKGHYIPLRFKITYYINNRKYAMQSVDYGSSVNPLPVPEDMNGFHWDSLPDKMDAMDIEVNIIKEKI